ncbi:hypothetical protein [Natrinema salsiterrestre]|uniref:Uncharacterized protein n=1 Tax=Natrinema salsiterrestre TaxID=2950540 RepID=A0A9Q4Q3D8_9EURY|nr:hypothetical protein [Natrinema salsiterrestre]MDF9746148.1 hypothetical protein [Natrinema salsiterrestre]
MNDALVVGGCFVLALSLAGLTGFLTASPAILGVTAAGTAIYLAVGVGLPQYLLSRRSGSSIQLGLAALGVVAGVGVAVAGVAIGSPHDESSIGLVAILSVVVLGNLIGAGLREFRTGYRSAS